MIQAADDYQAAISLSKSQITEILSKQSSFNIFIHNYNLPSCFIELIYISDRKSSVFSTNLLGDVYSSENNRQTKNHWKFWFFLIFCILRNIQDVTEKSTCLIVSDNFEHCIAQTQIKNGFKSIRLTSKQMKKSNYLNRYKWRTSGCL